MIRAADASDWFEFERRLPASRDRLYRFYLPVDLPHRGAVRKAFDYVPPDAVLEAVKKWMAGRHETEVLYFLVEACTAEATDFVISLSSLTEHELGTMNPGRENVFVGVKGDWAMFMDHEGALHVAGPAELFSVVNEASS